MLPVDHCKTNKLCDSHTKFQEALCRQNSNLTVFLADAAVDPFKKLNRGPIFL
jgi:hypothetical protein